VNGPGHALTGAIAGLTIGPLIAARFGHPLDHREVLGVGLACAGAVLLSDLDTRGTASRTFGHAGRAVTRLVSWAAGGHRHGTHTLRFAAAAGVAVVLASAYWSWAVAVVLGVLAAWAWRALGPDIDWEFADFDVDAIAVGALAGWASGQLLEPGWWLPGAVAGGVVIHLAGDKLFGGRSPLRVGGTVERVVVWALTMALPVVVLVQTGVLVPAR
jgi:hypothetical protein